MCAYLSVYNRVPIKIEIKLQAHIALNRTTDTWFLFSFIFSVKYFLIYFGCIQHGISDLSNQKGG